MARLKGLTGQVATRSVEAACARLASARSQVLIGKLSRGYRQRVAVAQALLGDPALLILDEPTNGLDPRQIIEMRSHIRSLARERTVLVTSHILGEIERVADRVAILLGGRLLGVHALRGAAGAGQRIRLRVRGPADAVRACLGRVPGVSHVELAARRAERRGRLCRVDVGGPSVAESLAAAVVAGGFGLLDLGAGHRRPGGALPRAHRRRGAEPHRRRREATRHAPRQGGRRRSSRRRSPTPTIAVYLVLMGYTFTADPVPQPRSARSARLLPGGGPLPPDGPRGHDAALRRGAADGHARATADVAGHGDRDRPRQVRRRPGRRRR